MTSDDSALLRQVVTLAIANDPSIEIISTAQDPVPALEIRDGPLTNRHKSSVDALFRSVAQGAGKNALGIIPLDRIPQEIITCGT